ncbi:DUF4173 domain-containing protein [Streptomyces apricus]|uniref:DUF4173 domain-containing protein n=2 Tax=Streptomyces apricus TaxID=1828112 RepID=A0A5A9ZXW3_9ACTN|nr:DUF4173 domain-containing protein [Streptomyces apricus]
MIITGRCRRATGHRVLPRPRAACCRSRSGGGPVSDEPSENEPGGPEARSAGAATESVGTVPAARDDRAAAGARKSGPGPDGDDRDRGQGQDQGADEGGSEPWGGGPGPAVESWFADIRPRTPAPVRTATLWSALATGLLSMLLLGEGLALNLLMVAVPLTLGAYFAAGRAGRRPRPWTLVWGVGGLALLVVPALRDADWPSFLAVVAAAAVGSIALHGGRTWPGMLFGPIGLYTSLLTGPRWGWRGLRARTGGARGHVAPVLRATAVAAVLLVVFGTLFAGADAAFADLLESLVPDASVSGGPWRLVLFVMGVAGALAVAHTAAAPLRWDRVEVPPGRARGRVEWALPLVVLAALFAAFNAVQLAVLFGGYDAVLEKTGLTYAEYARQGFWQLLLVTLLTLVVVVLALRWAPRDGARDGTLVRAVLGTLCALALVVVASAVRRMDMYVEAYGLTRLRISVVGVELWLGLVIVLIMAAGVLGARWLPRAVLASAAAGVLAFGILSPDALIAERNVQRYEETGRFDLAYARGLSADAVPALDGLDEPLRSVGGSDPARPAVAGVTG